MDDSIEWKEAKSGEDNWDSDVDNEDKFEADQDETDQELGQSSEVDCESSTAVEEQHPSITDQIPQTSQYDRIFSHQRLNLSFRRNITALADVNQHQPRLTYANDSRYETFDSWLSRAIVAISPSADIILFSGRSPEQVTFFAKLRMDPINQYTTKQLEIPLDFDEQVTSVLCLPVMSVQKTAYGLVDWTALVIGLSSGYVRFYTEQSICLLSLKYCDEPVLSLKCQTQKSSSNARSEMHFAAITDEVLVQYKTVAFVLDGLGLYENLRLAKAEVNRSNSSYEPAYTLTNLPSILICQKWKIDSFRSSITRDGDLLGARRLSTFDSLLSESINLEEHIPAKSYARSFAFVGRDPFISCSRESTESNSHSYTELIGSIFSLWNKPQPSRTQIAEISVANNIGLFDKDRLANSIVSSPDKRMAAVTDDFGRVLLVDIPNSIVIRMWKGYRSAQCGWIEVRRNPEKRGSPQALFLVIYAPKRGLLEVWSAQRGPRVAAFNVGKHCRLLYCGHKMLNMRAESQQKNVPSILEHTYSSHCYLLNSKSETVFCVELPYTYSLYKYGDLKSRDHLLIAELMTVIQQDAEVDLISEILHRITLAESVHKSIQKIASGLGPDKVITIMENLINKTMRNYDNHSGEPMTIDDKSIIELSKRLLRLCAIFRELSNSTPNDLSLPDVNQRLIYQYEEHPQEIDEFSEKLGWPPSEVLRYLSFLALDRSYRDKHVSNPWPNTGEPLTWSEFISCFDIKPMARRYNRNDQDDNSKTQSKLNIKLKEINGKFLSEDRVMKTALFMYNRLSESYYKATSEKNSQETTSLLENSYNYLDPASRLALLVQFWLSTKLCNDWKMWPFLQNQIGQISDELKVIAMDLNDDKILIETWKQIYNLILESDNIYAAIVATATIKSDTLRMIKDNEKREKLEQQQVEDEKDRTDLEDRASLDWECLCIDAERMSILSQELEDVFLLNLLLKYSPTEGHLVEKYMYRVPRLSVANILRGGPTTVSELVAQWAVQSDVNLQIFTQPYGSQPSENDELAIASSSNDKSQHLKILAKRSINLDNEEHAKELLHHAKTAFPCSLEPDVVLMNCVWELCRQWSNSTSAVSKMHLLRRAYDCLPLLSNTELKHRLANVAYKTFFQRTFERLVILVETNSTVVNVKNSRLRDTLTRKELSMGEDCLEDFVQFCCDFSEFMLQTAAFKDQTTDPEDSESTKSRLLTYDRWWTTPTVVRKLDEPGGGVGSRSGQACRRRSSDFSFDSGGSGSLDNGPSAYSLVKTVLFTANLLGVNFLVELNSLSNLVNLIFKLKVVKSYPLTLIGEDSRKTLQIDSHQMSSGNPSDLRNRSTPIHELRTKFARKCILNLVGKMADEMNEFIEEEEEEEEDSRADCQKSSSYNSKKLGTRNTPMGPIFDVGPRQQRHKNDGSASGSRHKISSNAAATATELPEDNERQSGLTSTSGLLLLDDDVDDDDDVGCNMRDENNESMVLFANLLSFAKDWDLKCDELYLELVFELYRCNLDKIATQISNRILDQQTLANGLLKISSQRVLVLAGLSAHLSSSKWRHRSDKWSMFQPNVASWLKSIQQEESRREIAPLSFTESLKTSSLEMNSGNGGNSDAFGVPGFVLKALRQRTRLVLERITNHLDGQAGRLAYDLLQLLESQVVDRLWAESAASTTGPASSSS